MNALFASLSGNRLFPESMIGFESATRAMRLVLLDQLNDEIDRQSERWNAADLELQTLGLDPGVGQVNVEHVPDENLHEGPHLPLLTAPIERFPNVSVIAYVTRATPGQGFADQVDSQQITLAFETMVKAGPVPDGPDGKGPGPVDVAFATIVHRRIQRTTEAVNAVLRRNPTLLGAVLPMQSPGVGGIGQQSWIKRQEGGQSPRYMWQGSRIEYTAQRISTF